MNKYLLLSLTLLATTGCRNYYQGQVVKETYEHKYGLPVSGADFEKQGKTGKIVQLLKDGVTVTRSLENGLANGITSWTFPNTSTIHREEEYENGTLMVKRENYSSGMPQREERFDEKGVVTQRLRWYEDGTPAGVEHYVSGLLMSGEYRTPLNLIESRVQDGVGTRVLRSGDGELIAKDTITDGELVERISYYSNGDPASIAPYADGEIHGDRLTYFRGGLPKTVEHWVHGKQQGSTLVYHNGEKFAEVPYIGGEKHGVELRYRDGDLLVEELSWLHNKQHGPHKIYVDGSTKVEWYHQGQIVSRPTFERLNPPTAER